MPQGGSMLMSKIVRARIPLDGQEAQTSGKLRDMAEADGNAGISGGWVAVGAVVGEGVSGWPRLPMSPPHNLCPCERNRGPTPNPANSPG